MLTTPRHTPRKALGGASNKRKLAQGFTIVELLIVIVVIAILAAISIVAYMGIHASAEASAIKSDMSNNARKIEQFKVLGEGNAPINAAQFRSAELQFSRDAYNLLFYCANGDTFSLGARSTRGNLMYYSSTRGLQESTWSTSASTACASMGVDPSGAVIVWLLPGPSNGWNTNWTP